MRSDRTTFTAVTQNDLNTIRQYIRKSALEMGAEEAAVSEMVIAANEAVTNIIIHGYGESVGDITVELLVDATGLTVLLLDEAPEFDPTAVPTPDTSLPPLQRRPGGLGVHMMRQFVDSITYERTPKGQNALCLQKGENHAA